MNVKVKNQNLKQSQCVAMESAVEMSCEKLLNIVKADKDLSSMEKEQAICKLLLGCTKRISSEKLNEHERRILIAPFNYSR